MIPEAAVTYWRNVVPWPQDAQVEQDLILSRALIEIFQEPALSQALLLRGGTALHKLFISPPPRYSEDIDLVQTAAGPIGPVLDAIRARLDPLLGKPRRENNPDNVTLRYRMESEIPPVTPLRLKVEINTREHFPVFGKVGRSYSIRSPWFEGWAEIQTYTGPYRTSFWPPSSARSTSAAKDATSSICGSALAGRRSIPKGSSGHFAGTCRRKEAA